MSFILDALRKSEHERDQRILPGLVEAPRSKSSNSAVRWIVGLVAALFVVNTGGLLYLLLREPPRPIPAPVATPVIPQSASDVPPAPVADAPAKIPPPTGAVHSLSDEALNGSRTSPYTDVPPTPRPRQPILRREPAPTVSAAGIEPDPASAGLPTRRQLPATVASALPALSVDLHVYSPNASQRFLVVSGQRAQEGATLAGGVVIEKITPDGAIATFRGTRFLLTRE
jgi:general secretion pathway protein B